MKLRVLFTVTILAVIAVACAGDAAPRKEAATNER